MKIFSTKEYEPFADRLQSTQHGDIERTLFPDGELGLRITTPVNGEDVVFVGGTWNDSVTLEIYDCCCAIAKYGARSLTLVVPYYGCSTMERAVHDGDVVTAKTRARLLSAIPHTSVGNRILLLDLHNEGIPYYFEGDLTATHIYGKQIVKNTVENYIQDADWASAKLPPPPARQHRDYIDRNKFVIASTDAGRAKWVESLASDLDLPVAFIIKRRVDGSTTKVLSISADVKDKIVIIYDDMIRSGGSLIDAARAYRDAGATSVYAVATHGVFTDGAVDRMMESKQLEFVSVTDSHPNAMKMKKLYPDFVWISPCADLFVPWLPNSSPRDPRQG